MQACKVFPKRVIRSVPHERPSNLSHNIRLTPIIMTQAALCTPTGELKVLNGNTKEKQPQRQTPLPATPKSKGHWKMKRQVVTARDTRRAKKILKRSKESSEAAEKPDGYLDRFLKYIPTEVIVIYLTVMRLLPDDAETFWPWVVYGVCQALTPIILYALEDVKKWKQLVFSTVSFFFWAAATPGPFADIKDFDEIYATVLLPLYSFLVAYFEPDDFTDAETDIEDEAEGEVCEA